MNPNYVLRANEAVLVPRKDAGGLVKLKPFIWGIAGAILLLSFLFGGNIFGQLSWPARILLIALILGTLFISSDERVPSPFEIRFYDDCLILYREKYYHSKRVSRMEYDKFYYKDIKECEFFPSRGRVNFYGVVEGIWYTYNKDGTLPQEPSYHKTTDSIRYFYTTFAQNVDFVREIESHSPIKVTIKAQ